MAASDTSIVILAAGKGTRMRSALAKVLHLAGGRTLIEHVVRACEPLKPAQLLVVVGHQAEEVSAVATQLATKIPVQTVVQHPQRGTGHAIQISRRAIRKSSKLALVIAGDAALLRPETLAALLDTHRRGEAAATILSAEVADAAGYGRIIRDSEGRVQAIVEDKSATPEQREIHEVNSSIYCFTLEKLWPCLSALRLMNARGASSISPTQSPCFASATNASSRTSPPIPPKFSAATHASSLPISIASSAAAKQLR